MSAIAYPNPAVPAPHAFVLDVPDGWSAQPAPRGLMMLTPDEHDPAFHPNVVISCNRVAADLDLKQVGAEALRAAARVGDDPALEVGKVGRLNGRTVYIQTLAVTLRSTGQRVAQLHMVFFGPADSIVSTEAGRTADLYTFVGTCLDADAVPYAPLFLTMATSFTFGPRLAVPRPKG